MVEFAMTGAMLLLSILWLLEVGLTYMTTLELEGATNDVARVVRTHRVADLPVPVDVKKKGEEPTSSEILAGKFRKRMCDRLVFAVDCKANLKVVVRSADDFLGLNTAQPIPDPYADDAEISINIGLQNQYVIVNAFFKSPLSVFGQERTIRAAAVTQNEP
ncbi:MAG: hypothetical protein ACR2O1_02020 [Boseongicola sp.]